MFNFFRITIHSENFSKHFLKSVRIRSFSVRIFPHSDSTWNRKTLILVSTSKHSHGSLQMKTDFYGFFFCCCCCCCCCYFFIFCHISWNAVVVTHYFQWCKITSLMWHYLGYKKKLYKALFLCWIVGNGPT